ncbi:AraC family transcriptional regulator [Paenibacillus lycopersici]|uniref:AraC family transcriptional regulator n=1 Tax=Paenibacillus lycopersici TaxID=2704462 RepID=A0A6C0FWD1_9BACL|nr:AraC family transcriptional regulator [Paenibacillus lycopersici]QHT61027.1 AraC family transcriptional regulator [Paenibacillus lycopersici]
MIDRQPSAEAPGLSGLLFMQTGLALHARSSGWTEAASIGANAYRLFAVTEGAGRFRSGASDFTARQGDCVLLGADEWHIGAGGDSGFRYYELAFVRLMPAWPGAGCGATDTGLAELPWRGRITALSEAFARLTGQLEALSADQAAPDDALSRMRAHIRFQELLLFAFEQFRAELGARVDSRSAVERIVERLSRDFREEWSIERMASDANLGVWQFRRLFRELTGRNPNEYIAELRIERAKELLFASDEPLAAVARKVGFHDEYYFSRRFRQLTGHTPRTYARSQPRVVAFTHYGDMLSLGSKPLAAEHSLLDWLRGSHTVGVQPIDMNANGLEQVQALRPDLILVNAYTSPAFADELKRIAPTETLLTGRCMFRQLADAAEIVGKRAEAREWLARYRVKAARLKAALRKEIGRRETAVFFHVVDRALYLYRPEEAPVLYDVLGFEPPDSLRRLIAERGDTRLFVPADAFAAYEADRVFVVSGRHAVARETLSELLRNPAWAAMEAAKRGRVYFMDESWSLDGSIALEWQLDGMTELLRTERR